MKLNALTTAQLRSGIVFGVRSIPYFDGATVEGGPDTLREIRGVYPVDVTNAIVHDDPKAWDVILTHGFLAPAV